MPVLTPAELGTALGSLPEWSVDDGMLVRRYVFEAGFMRAIAFVDAVAVAAEDANHHPDIDIRWNAVTLRLVTHDEGGITGKDVALAATCDALAGTA